MKPIHKDYVRCLAHLGPDLGLPLWAGLEYSRVQSRLVLVKKKLKQVRPNSLLRKAIFLCARICGMYEAWDCFVPESVAMCKQFTRVGYRPRPRPIVY